MAEGLHKYTPQEAVNISTGQVGSAYLDTGFVDTDGVETGTTFTPENGVIVCIQNIGYRSSLMSLVAEDSSKFFGSTTDGLNDKLTDAQKAFFEDSLSSDNFEFDFHSDSVDNLVHANGWTAVDATFTTTGDGEAVITNTENAKGYVSMPFKTVVGEEYFCELATSNFGKTGKGIGTINMNAVGVFNYAREVGKWDLIGGLQEDNDDDLSFGTAIGQTQSRDGYVRRTYPAMTATATTSYIIFGLGTTHQNGTCTIDNLTIRKAKTGWEKKGDIFRRETNIMPDEHHANTSIRYLRQGVNLKRGQKIFGRWKSAQVYRNIDDDAGVTTSSKIICYIG